MKKENNFRKEFRKKYYNTIVEFYKRLRNSGLIGSITTAEIVSDVKIKTRGDTNLSSFIERNIEKSKGETILTPMQYKADVESMAIAADFVVWETKRFGKILTTIPDMKRIIEMEVKKLVRGLTDDTYMNTIIPQLAVKWVWDSTYKDAIGSVYSILSYWDYEADATVSIYLDGSVAIDNVEQESKLTEEEMANHLLGMIKGEFQRRGYKL